MPTFTKSRNPPPRLDNNDGPIKLIKASMSPFNFLKGRAEKERKDRLRSWSRGLHNEYILDFIKYGLEPFLDKFGYKLSYSHEDCAAYCKEWAFVHNEIQTKYKPNQTINFLRCTHNGSQDEFEWYLEIISPDDWYTLCDEWSDNRFLDDSDAGHSQRNDIAWFVWNILSLDSSREHHNFMEFMYSKEDMDDETHHMSGINGEDNLGTYGGDRRTL